MLNRVVSSTKEGIEYEGDQRHAETIIMDVGLGERSKRVTTPGVSDEAGGEEDDGVGEEASAASATSSTTAAAPATFSPPSCAIEIRELLRSNAPKSTRSEAMKAW